MKNIVFGIDIGGTFIKIGKFSKEGLLIEQYKIPTDTSNKGENILKSIYNKIISTGVEIDSVIGYGFGVPGPLKDNTVIENVNLGLKNYDIKKEFSKLTNNKRIVAINDCNSATLGEYYNNPEYKNKSVYMMTIGTGLGAGYILDNKLVKGSDEAVGEVGHIIVEPKGRLCNCGKRGCIETIVSAKGILNKYHELCSSEKVVSSLEEITVPNIFLAAKNNSDPISIKTIEYFTYYLAYTCDLINLTINPDFIILGGGVSNAGDYLLNQVVNKYNEMKLDLHKNTQIRLASLANDAGMYGAAYSIINQI